MTMTIHMTQFRSLTRFSKRNFEAKLRNQFVKVSQVVKILISDLFSMS